MTRIVPIIVLMILASFLGCKKDAPEGDVLARVSDAVLTLQGFHAEIPVEYIMSLTPEQKMGFVDRWINTELVYQEAVKQGLDKEEKIAERLRQVQKELLANEFLQREMAGKAAVSNEELEDYFKRHESEFNTEIKIAHILTASPDTARALVARIREGAEFSALAKKYSLDPSGEAGGVTDYIRRGDMASAPEFEDAAFALDKPGQLSNIVQSGYGYHIVKLVSRRRLTKAVRLEDVSDQIRDGLLIKKQKEVFENLIAELRSRTNVEVHPELLAPYSPAPRIEPEGN